MGTYWGQSPRIRCYTGAGVQIPLCRVAQGRPMHSRVRSSTPLDWWPGQWILLAPFAVEGRYDLLPGLHRTPSLPTPATHARHTVTVLTLLDGFIFSVH